MAIIEKEDFSGIKRTIPGVYGKFQSPTSQAVNLDLNTLVIIGGADNAPYYGDTTKSFEERYITVGSFQDAKNILKGGELLEAVNLAKSPAKDTEKPVFNLSKGASLYKLVNINPNVAATITLDSTKATNTHTITYGMPGTYGNKVRVRKILADKKIQVNTPDGSSESSVLEKKVFELTYTGDATTAILAIDSTGITVILTGQTDESTNLSVLFADYPRLGDAIEYINSQQGYVAIMLDVPSFELSNLDHIEAAEAIDVKLIKTIHADLYAEIQYIEGTGLGKFTTIATVRKPLADMTVFKFFSGGSIGTPSANDMKGAIDFSKTITGMFRNVLTSNISDLLYFKSACSDMIASGNETVGGCGGAVPTSEILSVRQANARQLAGYVKYGVSPFYAYDLNGIKKEYPGYMLAVLDNAISASVSPRISATHKYLSPVLDTSEVLSRDIGGDLEKTIQAGGLAISRKSQSQPFWIERSITTESALNPIKTDSATFAGALTSVKTIRERLEPLIGMSTVDKNAKVQGVTEQDLIREFDSALQYLMEQGFLVGSELLGITPFDEEYKLRLDGDAVYVEMKGRSFSVINFIFFLIGLEEIQGTV
ncbi:MAG: hypothetical protein KDK36_10995 [Leptospiraceae bacterium]|nr:hypothetical protein [Leptospiraceae bacterium]